jgi:hypothetical protein
MKHFTLLGKIFLITIILNYIFFFTFLFMVFPNEIPNTPNTLIGSLVIITFIILICFQFDFLSIHNKFKIKVKKYLKENLKTLNKSTYRVCIDTCTKNYKNY